jgi:hypothetical protein
MPAGDGSGPAGMGPRTGRGAGYCSGYDAPGWANWGAGRGFGGWRGRSRPGAGFGRGRGGGAWGRQHRYYPAGFARRAGWGTAPAWAYGAGGYAPYESPTREQELEALRGEAEWLRGQLDAINRRVEELNQE